MGSRKLKLGMLVTVNHPEVSSSLEWLVTDMQEGAAFGSPDVYSLKSTGKVPMSMILLSNMDYAAMDNTLPPVLTPIMGMPQGNSYHQDRKLIKRIIDGVYTTKLVRPQTDFPLGKTAKASWDKSVVNELEQNIHAFKKDLREVCGTRKKDGTSQTFGISYSFSVSADNFDNDYVKALRMWRDETGRQPNAEFPYDSWVTFMGIYCCYRKVLEEKE